MRRLNWPAVAFWCCIAAWTVIGLALTGCATLPTEQRITETAYQALHLADTMQTLQTAREPTRFQETNPLLSRHPSQAKVIAYMTAEAAAHAWVTQSLVDHGAPIWAQRTWAAVSVYWEAVNVSENARIGLSVSLPR